MNKKDRFIHAYEYLRAQGKVHTQKDVAETMQANYANVNFAFGGNERYLTNKFLSRFNKAFNNIFNEEWLINGSEPMLSISEESVNSTINNTDKKEISQYEMPNVNEMIRVISLLSEQGKENAQANKINAEANKINAEANDRNSKNMERMMEMLERMLSKNQNIQEEEGKRA